MTQQFTRIGVVGTGPETTALAGLLGSGDAVVTLGEAADLTAFASCDLIVEALPEDAVAKAAVLAALGAVAPDAVLATSTRVLPVTALASTAPMPSRVLGLRLTRLGGKATGLVELTRTILTDAEVLADVQALAAGLGVQVVTVADRVGAVSTALLLPYLNDAVRMLEARYASREDIDAAMRFGCGHPTGPLALLDLLGLDTAVDVLTALHDQTGDHLHAPAPLLAQYVSAGRVGLRSGRGFYSYDGDGAVVPDELTPVGAVVDAAPRAVRRIGVIGTGTMASGIVEVCARSGYDVVFRARSHDKVVGVQQAIEASLAKAVSRGKLDEAGRDEVVRRIEGTTHLAGLADCDLVVEAVVEDLAVKQALFVELDRVLKPGAVLATTTSSLPVVECARVTSRPQDVIGMHWFNPATVMRLVEVVPTVLTAPDVVATVLHLCDNIGKQAVLCGDRPGFIVNALLFPYLNDAVRLLEAGVATMDEIDTAVVGALGHPMGPFALIDVVGVDVTLAIQQTLHAASREPGHAPAPSLGHLVVAGALGRKTGRGLRSYARS